MSSADKANLIVAAISIAGIIATVVIVRRFR